MYRLNNKTLLSTKSKAFNAFSFDECMTSGTYTYLTGSEVGVQLHAENMSSPRVSGP